MTSFTLISRAGAFFSTGDMTTLRSGQTATLLTNGMVLVAGGRDRSTFQETAAAELYDPATGQWTPTAPMSTPRLNHTANLLPDGRVLIAGGTGTNFAAPTFGTLTNAELYDPVTSTWSPTGPLNVARRSHTASLLPNGKVLVAGGTFDQSGRTELYDPTDGTWTLTGSMTTNRQDHTATVLTNGMVVVAGGEVTISTFSSEVTDTAELFNPADGTWTATGSMTTNRMGHTATLLKNGKVLVVANVNSGSNSGDTSAELYDPVSGTWSATGSMHVWRDQATATRLQDGEVLVTGGDTGGDLKEVAELYNPASGQWVSAGTLVSVRIDHTATLLQNGQVLLAGGSLSGPFGGPGAELYNPDTAWKATGSLNIPREGVHTLTLLTNGEVLLVGDSVAGEGVSPEVYDPSNGTWTVIKSMNEPREFHTATLLANGKVVVAGGHGFNGGINNGVLASAELYDPVTGDWTETGSMENARANHQATLLKNGKVLVTGRDVYNHDSAELYDPVAGTWSTTASTASLTSGTTLLPDGEVLAVESNGNAERFDPTNETWSPAGTMSVAFSEAAATVLSNGKVFVVGPHGGLPVGEIYDPADNSWIPAAATTNAISAIGATKLADGRILIMGAEDPQPTPNAELYDAASDTWTPTFGRMTSGRAAPPAVSLPDGRVLVAGDDTDLTSGGTAAELFDPNVGNTQPIVLVPSRIFIAGAFDFSFDAPPGTTFTVLSATNASLATTNWTEIGSALETAPGHFEFSDSQAPSNSQRFYRVRSP